MVVRYPALSNPSLPLKLQSILACSGTRLIGFMVNDIKDTSMKKSIILLLAIALFAAPALGYKQEDLDKLRDTYNCVKCDLRESNLTGVNLTGVNLYRADLRRADLRKADLSDTNLGDTNLTGTVLEDANLSGANLSGAHLWEANLQGVNLQGAVLRAADLDYARMKGAIFCNTVMPDGQRIFKDC